MFMVSLLVQSTVFFGSRVQSKTADNEHFCLDAEVRQDGSSLTQRLDLCRRTERAEKPALLAEFLVLNNPHNSSTLWHKSVGFFDFYFFFASGASPVSPTTSSPPWKQLWTWWDARLPEGAPRISASVGTVPASPGSHTCISQHALPFTLHHLGANNRKGSFTNIWNAMSVIN